MNGRGLLFAILFTAQICVAQTLFVEENFDYSFGLLTDLTANWTGYPLTGSTKIQVVEGNLVYTNYPSSGIGKRIYLNGGATGRQCANIGFTTVSGNGNSVYASFLLTVSATNDLDLSTSSGDYVVSFQKGQSSTRRCYIYLKQGSSSDKFSIGLAKASADNLEYSTAEYDINVTYLIVMCYVFQSGNDAVKLWINPDLSGAEPTEDLSTTSGSDTDFLDCLELFQKESSGDEYIDGIRISDSWSQAPLPVELTSFTAKEMHGAVQLNWETATEVNNYGFEIERASSGTTPVKDWSGIGFVEGNGNSNSYKKYSFIDKSPASGVNYYRLKQIDLDGSFEYSEVVEVSLFDNEYGTFKLEQNYPNPFNPVTIINYSVPQTSFVNISVFDVLGNKICTLVNEEKTPGVYQTEYNNLSASDGRGLASGIYYYRLTVGNFTKTMKMAVVK